MKDYQSKPDSNEREKADNSPDTSQMTESGKMSMQGAEDAIPLKGETYDQLEKAARHQTAEERKEEMGKIQQTDFLGNETEEHKKLRLSSEVDGKRTTILKPDGKKINIDR